MPVLNDRIVNTSFGLRTFAKWDTAPAVELTSGLKIAFSFFGNFFESRVSLKTMSSFSRCIATAAVVALFVGSAMPQTKPYPKPQVASATGQMAPDFTLKDQQGEDFTLSDQRGRWVLLFFYRGYW